MRVSVSIENEPFHSLWMRFVPEGENDLKARAGTASYANLRDTPVITELPPGTRIQGASDIHPDLIALSALLVCGQMTVEKLHLPILPSAEMTAVARDRFGIEMTGSGARVSSREKGGQPGLAFSGGVDSCAALLLMPPETTSVFMHRFSLGQPGRTAYNASAALRSVEALQASARRATVLRCNVETIRTPVGFPVDWSNALPLVINADALGLSSISFGTVLESASGLGKLKFSDLSRRTIYSRWAPAFDAAGLSMSLPVAGLSEVLTSKIVRERGAFMHPQSCVRGTPGEPCRRCFKCFRKSLTEWALGGPPMTEDQITTAVTSREVSARLKQVPIHHEIGFAWALANIQTENPVLNALQERSTAFVAACGGLEFVENPYWPNIDQFVPASLRFNVLAATIDAFGEPRAIGSQGVEEWDVQPILESTLYRSGVKATVAALENVR